MHVKSAAGWSAMLLIDNFSFTTVHQDPESPHKRDAQQMHTAHWMTSSSGFTIKYSNNTGPAAEYGEPAWETKLATNRGKRERHHSYSIFFFPFIVSLCRRACSVQVKDELHRFSRKGPPYTGMKEPFVRLESYTGMLRTQRRCRSKQEKKNVSCTQVW